RRAAPASPSCSCRMLSTSCRRTRSRHSTACQTTCCLPHQWQWWAPKDHKYLYKQILEKENLEQIHRIKFTDDKGITHIYAWCNDLPLNGSANAAKINFFEYWKVKDNDKIIWANSWVTDIPVNINNVKELVKAGRARWKIENENFNTLKNQGYHADHNFGHGKKKPCLQFFLIDPAGLFRAPDY
ncbi:MAG: hypothetical protein R6U27_11700, partial [Desulfobacterales bacterium]